MPDRRRFLTCSGLAAGGLILPGLRRSTLNASLPNDSLPADTLQYGTELPLIRGVDPRRFIDQAGHVLAAAESLGISIPAEDVRTLEAIQRVLDRSCLVAVHINPEMRVKVAQGPARPSLVERAWWPFLVKVHNEAGTTAALRATSVQGTHRWLDHLLVDDPPLTRTLSGLALDYRIVRLYSHATGLREASLAFDVGQGTQDLGFRNEVPILFDCRPVP